MTVKEFLVDPSKVTDAGEQVIIVELFRWMLSTLEDYSEIDGITIRNGTYLSIRYKNSHLIHQYPLLPAVMGQLMPALIEEFRLVRATTREALGSPLLRQLSVSPTEYYEYYNMHSKLPINMMLLLHGYITGDKPGEDDEVEEVTKYKHVAALVT